MTQSATMTARVASAVTRPWVGPLVLVTAVFLFQALPPYLGLDPAQARIPVVETIPWYYPMLVTHIFLGSIVLATACLQVWPRLRARYPAVHRWSGRLYVASVVPAAAALATIVPFLERGANQQFATGLLTVLWLGATLLGFRAARRRDFGAHREWMVRSFALSFSIVANRPWLMLCMGVYTPEIFTGAPPDTAALHQAVGVSAWMSMVVNLIVAELWLGRTRAKQERARAAAARARRERSRAAAAPEPVGDRGAPA